MMILSGRRNKMTQIRDGRTILKDIKACRARLRRLELELDRYNDGDTLVTTNAWRSRKLDSYDTGFVLSGGI